MKLSPLRIGEIVAKVPIIQGGMGIGVSGPTLASAVSNAGGIGVISGVQIGYKEHDFEYNTKEANERALRKAIRKAKALSPNGILGVNIMVAATDYKNLIKASVEESIDLIICGAGLPTDLPIYVKNSKTKIAPIVSSGKAASIISRLWIRNYNYIPDFIVVEGPKAGGHLGFTDEELCSNSFSDLTQIINDVVKVATSLENTHGKHIPVIAAGGIFDGNDIAKALNLGAEGVQMATRFVATKECDAHINFKNAYVSAKKEDIVIVKSPVGMPGRAIKNKFISKVEKCNIQIKKCYNCLKPCDPKKTPYCISKALINAVTGDIDNGLIFCGSNAYKINKIYTVKELIDSLVQHINKIND